MPYITWTAHIRNFSESTQDIRNLRADMITTDPIQRIIRTETLVWILRQERLSYPN